MSPRPSAVELKRLKELEDDLVEEGLSRHQAHQHIARVEGVNDSTIYRWLTPGKLEQCADYNRAYRQRPEVKEARRRYNREYQRFVYHLDEHLPAVLGEDAVTLSQLSVRVLKQYRFELHPATLEKYVKRFGHKHGMCPLDEEAPGVFQLNHRYYSRHR